MSKVLNIDDPGVFDRACDTLADGGLVAIPTETVYGLAADATNGEAVARIYAAKGRPSFNPLIIHCADMAMVERYALVDDRAKRCAEAMWPGALTLVLPSLKKSGVSSLVRAGLPTIAVRIPKGPARGVIEAFGKPLAAPSANLSGRVSPTEASHVLNQLGTELDLILDGGPCSVGLESTILSLSGDQPVLLRPGGLPVDVLEGILGEEITRASGDAAITAPGMMASHYAPKGRVRLNANRTDGDDAVLNFGSSNLAANVTLNLSDKGDLKEAASNLFAYLNQLDALGVSAIAVAPIPNHGLGLAINDRLARAAAPRDS